MEASFLSVAGNAGHNSTPALASVSLSTARASWQGAAAQARGRPPPTRPGDKAHERLRHPPAAPPTQPAAGVAPPAAAHLARRIRRPRRAWPLPILAGALGAALARAAAAQLFPRVATAAAHVAWQRPANMLRGLVRRVRGGGGGANAGPAPGARKPALVWFRNDLRLADHAPLVAATTGATSLLPVYCFDPREYGKSASGFDKTGPHRARFVIEALADLRARLRAAGSDLLVRVGRPEQVLPALARQVGAGAVYAHAEVTQEERGVEAAVATALDRGGCRLVVEWGGTLFHPRDLPFRLAEVPTTYGDFRSRVAAVSVRAALDAPRELKSLPAGSPDVGELPSLRQLGFSAACVARCAADTAAKASGVRGGEGEALRQLEAFAARAGGGAGGSAQPAARAVPGGGAAANGFSCHIAPWLALGCLSPRHLYQRLRQDASGATPAEGATHSGASWLLFELLWRDFFRFITAGYTASGSAQHQPAMAAAT